MGDEKGEAIGNGGGDGGDEGMQCREHPYRSNPGGICAFCLQEKLGKLVSSSNSSTSFFPLHPPPSSNNSSPPSFRSVNTSSTSTSTAPPSATTTRNGNGRSTRPSKIPYFLSRPSSIHHHQYNKKSEHLPKSSSSSSTINTSTTTSSSKSAAPKPTVDRTVAGPPTLTADSPRKKSFWSFLYISSSSPSQSIGGTGTSFSTNAASLRRRSVSSYSSSRSQGENKDLAHLGSIPGDKSDERSGGKPAIVVEEDETLSPGGGSNSHSQASSSSFGRKVARSRSVGCGSRSFSGDFLERLSNGFGDCTLRRVESHRESNNKPDRLALHGHLDDGDDNELEQRMRRIRCSGFFGSSASSYWLSGVPDHNGARMSTGGGGRSLRSGWAFASPMRAFKPTTTASSASSVKSMPITSSNVLPPPVT